MGEQQLGARNNTLWDTSHSFYLTRRKIGALERPEDGVTKTYKFISSGDPRINIGAAAVSAASNARSSTADESGIELASSTRSLVTSSQELEGRYFTLSPSEGTALRSDKRALAIIIK